MLNCFANIVTANVQNKTLFVLETHFFSSIMLPVSLAFIMLGMGLSLTRKEFANIFLRPKAVFVGLATQMLALPVIAFSIAWIFPVPPEIKVGLFLVAICPGGATSNLLNYLLNGNLALCVSLTTINSFLTQASIPLLLNFALRFFMHSGGVNIQLSFWETLQHIVLITLVPVIVGIIIAHYKPTIAEKLRKPMKWTMPILMAIALLGAIILEKKERIVEMTTSDYLTIVPMALLLNGGALFAGYYIAKWCKLSKKTSVTISLEVGLHNTVLAIYIATTILKMPIMALPAIVYAMFTFFTSAGFGIWKSGVKVPLRSLFTGRKTS
jgi:BASS family bile acid:Na+ symporter